MEKAKANKTLLEMESLDEAAKKLEEVQFKLSAEQSRLVELTINGDFYKQISSQLNMTERAVRFHRANLMAKIRHRRQISSHKIESTIPLTHGADNMGEPPINAEYVLYLFLRREERESVIGDLVECYDQLFRRFGKRRADIWFYKQVGGSLFALLRRAVLRIGALVWLGRVLRRLIS